MRLAAAAVAVAAGAAGAALGIGCALQEARSESPPVLEIAAVPVQIVPTELKGLRLRGAVELTANHDAFGGISGMLIEPGTLLAVTDDGWLLRSPLVDDEAGLRPVGGEIAPLLDEAGGRLEDSGRDAEALAHAGGALAVAFERDHRVVILDGYRPGKTVRADQFERLQYNGGLEGLATLPDDRMIAIAEAETPEYGIWWMILLDAQGQAAARALPTDGPHLVTGADVGPDGRLYLVKRRFSLFSGFSIRIERYRLGPDGFPIWKTRERLAAFESEGGIDNMEAIALWRDGGRTRLAIASDDNFSFLQRTLLIDFEVLD
jgi:hypothetical protein